ncbi:succinylglutamate desuccinylase/aspartoacylase family protein [Microbacterium sp. ZW T5_56]|uniref:succinylglutamate desuccinylase/aspartoacylase family protein n=1 Tax=Microbacterium sp. ZW T5_56 TaxID=3378081 RepID=UPI003853C13E
MIARHEPMQTADGTTVDAFHLDSGAPGPTVAIVAGIHGNEVAGIVALSQLVREDLDLRAGRVRFVPIAHPAAHAANLRVSPHDGLNLARVFPGDPDGKPTEQLAALIADRVIAGSDVLIDLHTSSPDTDMPFFAGCLDDGSPECALAVALCDAFGAGVVWTHPEVGVGRTLTTAKEHGISALYVESPQGGVLPAPTLSAYRDGVLRMLAHLGMLADVPAGRATALRLHGNGDVDRAMATTASGFFVAERSLLDEVSAGDVIGRVIAHDGSEALVCAAPVDGVITVLRRQAIVAAGDVIFELGTRRPA